MTLLLELHKEVKGKTPKRWTHLDLNICMKKKLEDNNIMLLRSKPKQRSSWDPTCHSPSGACKADSHLQAQTHPCISIHT